MTREIQIRTIRNEAGFRDINSSALRGLLAKTLQGGLAVAPNDRPGSPRVYTPEVCAGFPVISEGCTREIGLEIAPERIPGSLVGLPLGILF